MKMIESLHNPTSSMRILIVSPTLSTSLILAVLQPLMHLRSQLSFRIEVDPTRARNYIGWASHIIFCRSHSQAQLDILDLALSRGIHTIYVIDDNLLELPENLRDSPLSHFHNQRRILEFVLRSRHVVVYSALMYRRVVALRATGGILMPTHFEMPADVTRCDLDSTQRNRTVVLASARFDSKEIESLVGQSMLHFLELHSDWKFITYRPNTELRGHPRVEYRVPVNDYRGFIAELCALRPTIGLAPLVRNNFYDAKTDNKYREYGALGIVGIYSDSPVYASVTNESTGFVADANPAKWVEILDRLASRPQEAFEISLQARKHVTEKYPIGPVVANWKRLLLGQFPGTGVLPPPILRVRRLGRKSSSRDARKLRKAVEVATGRPALPSRSLECILDVPPQRPIYRQEFQRQLIHDSVNHLEIGFTSLLESTSHNPKTTCPELVSSEYLEAKGIPLMQHPWVPDFTSNTADGKEILVRSGELGSPSWERALHWALMLSMAKARSQDGEAKLSFSMHNGRSRLRSSIFVTWLNIRWGLSAWSPRLIRSPRAILQIARSRYTWDGQLSEWNQRGSEALSED